MGREEISGFESMLESISLLTCTPTPKRQRISIEGNSKPPLLASISNSFTDDEEEDEDRTLETLARKRCNFYKYDANDKKWSKKQFVTAIIGKHLRRGIGYGVVWLIIKDNDGKELLEHVVEPYHIFNQKETDLKKFHWRVDDVMYCLVFKDDVTGSSWKEVFVNGRGQTSLAWSGFYEDKKSDSNNSLRL